MVSPVLPQRASSHCPALATPGGESAAGFFIHDAAEALTNAVIGLLVSWAATLWVLGYSPAQSALITGMFFVLSFTRAWIVRAAFRRWSNAA